MPDRKPLGGLLRWWEPPQQWACIRAHGPLIYVLRAGMIRFGMTCSLLFTVAWVALEQMDSLSTLQALIVTLAVFLPAGVLVGLLAWALNEQAYTHCAQQTDETDED